MIVLQNDKRRRWRPLDQFRRRRLGALEALEGRELLSTNVLSYHDDQASTGQNLNETVLTPDNVNIGTFGRLADVPLDGQVYAQPLYVEKVNITTGPSPGLHNVAFIATEHDSVYAIDANDGMVLWHDSFINPALGITTVPSADVGSDDLSPEMGITGTGVIDQASNTLYITANTKEVRADGVHYIYTLHALDLSTGVEKPGGPLVLGNTIDNHAGDGKFIYVSGPRVNGVGDGNINGQVPFNALTQLQRPGLSLVNGTVYIGFGSHGDNPPAHGWLMGVDAHTLTLTAAFNTTPNGSLGSIWQSGDSVVVDAQGNLYVSTGNGNRDIFNDYGDSVLKLAPDPTSNPLAQNPNGWGLKVVDYFTPKNQAALNDSDLDVGSGGIMLLPDSAGSASHPHLLVLAGKQGVIYLIDRDNMGGFNPNTDQVVQEVAALSHNLSTPAYFNGSIYFASQNQPIEQFIVSKGAISGPVSSASDANGIQGATPSISADGIASGIAWLLDPGTNQLRAYKAGNLADEIFTSSQAPGGRDLVGKVVKFSVPTVADGEVLVGASNNFDIYGLLGSSTPNQRLVAAAYQSILGRSAGSAEVSFWTTEMDTGRVSRSQFASALAQSAEYYGDLITAAYQRYLGRDPDAPGLQSWISAMQTGLSDELLEANLIGSPEFYVDSGGTDKGWVDAMYFDVLGRAPDSPGENNWIGVLAAGASWAAVSYDFTSSQEREGDRVAADYMQLLGRTASNAEIAGWVQAIQQGEANEDVVAGFVASVEYFDVNSDGP